MPKRRRRPAAGGGSGGSGGAPAAAAALEEAPRDDGAAEYRSAEWLRRPLDGAEIYWLEQMRGALSWYERGENVFTPEEFRRMRELLARRAGEALWRLGSASREEREFWEEFAVVRLRELRLLDRGAAEALEDGARAFVPRFEWEDVRYREGYESRLGRPLSRAEGEIRRFRDLWERWNSWRRHEDVQPLDPDEMGELHEYLQRRLVLPLRNARRAASPEELAAAQSELRDRWDQFVLFAVNTFPRSWRDRHRSLTAAVDEALRIGGEPGRPGGLHPEADALERARREAMAAASGATDLAGLERAYAEFARAREAAEAAAERYRSAGAALPGELERVLRLAAEWDARFRQELERRRARG